MEDFSRFEEDVLTVEEAAEVTGCGSEKRIQSLIRGGFLRAADVGTDRRSIFRILATDLHYIRQPASDDETVTTADAPDVSENEAIENLPEWLETADFAQFFRLSPKSVRRMFRQGRFEVFQPHSKYLMPRPRVEGLFRFRNLEEDNAASQGRGAART